MAAKKTKAQHIEQLIWATAALLMLTAAMPATAQDDKTTQNAASAVNGGWITGPASNPLSHLNGPAFRTDAFSGDQRDFMSHGCILLYARVIGLSKRARAGSFQTRNPTFESNVQLWKRFAILDLRVASRAYLRCGGQRNL